MTQIILASTSPYRRELLSRLQLSFSVCAPAVDESPLPLESPAATAERLSKAKAEAIAQHHSHTDTLVIGSDQVAFRFNRRFGKPGTRDRAYAQLRDLSGKTVTFHSGLCLINCRTGRLQLAGIPTKARFRTLTSTDIEHYLDKEDALNCAGSARSEGLGITLLEWMRSDDPTALVGLPLIALSAMLRAEGIVLP